MATMAGAPRRLNALNKARRRERIFKSLRLGSSTADIAREEGLTARRVRQIVSEALQERQVDEARDHALLQLARLEPAISLMAGEMAQGDIRAVSPYLELLDRLDRYQVGAAAHVVYDEAARERLFAKMSRIAGREAKKTEKRAARAAAAGGGAAGRDADGAAAAEPEGPPASSVSP
jgi:hypothetical protein